MRVAFVLDTMIYGGIERVAINYLNILIKKGYTVDVFILNLKTESITQEIPKECNVKYVSFSKFLCPDFYWIMIEKYSWGKFLFPIIYLFLLCVTPILKLVKGRKKNYDLAISFSGHFNDLTYTANYINAKNKMCWLHGSLSSYILMSKGYGVLYNKIKKLIVLSEEGQVETLIYNPWLKCEISKLYNPIMLNNRVPDKKVVEELVNEYGDFILMIGRLSKQKDHYTVIDAIEILYEKYNISIPILFVGDGPDREEIEEYVSSKKIFKSIVFMGNQSEVQNYYKAAKLFIHSSPVEGLPTVLLEAMYYELPIVATDSKPGVREILGNSEFGLICSVKDPLDMAQAIAHLLTNNELMAEYKNKGLLRVKDFDEKEIARQLNEILLKIGGEGLDG